jgi:hypothetical protein
MLNVDVGALCGIRLDSQTCRRELCQVDDGLQPDLPALVSRRIT